MDLTKLKAGMTLWGTGELSKWPKGMEVKIREMVCQPKTNRSLCLLIENDDTGVHWMPQWFTDKKPIKEKMRVIRD